MTIEEIKREMQRAYGKFCVDPVPVVDRLLAEHERIVLEKAEMVAKNHRPPHTRISSSLSDEAYQRLQSEDRGELIAAQQIAGKIRSLSPQPTPARETT